MRWSALQRFASVGRSGSRLIRCGGELDPARRASEFRCPARGFAGAAARFTLTKFSITPELWTKVGDGMKG